MVKYQIRENNQYVLREGITVDDPVGAYLLEKLDKNPDAKTRIGRTGVKYSDLIEDFESGNMPKTTYDSLIKRIAYLKKSARQALDEAEVRRMSHSRLYLSLFGDTDTKTFSEKQALELSMAVKDKQSMMRFLEKYLKNKIDTVPEIYDFRERVSEAVSSGNIKGLEKMLRDLRSVIDMSMKGRFCLIQYADKDLFEKYRRVFNKGSIFDISEVYHEIESKYPKGCNYKTKF